MWPLGVGLPTSRIDDADGVCFFIPQLDIVQHEFIHELGLQQFEVVNAAFNGPGNWLATVEERKQKAAELELNLKLWAFNEQTQRCARLALNAAHATPDTFQQMVQGSSLLPPAVLCSTPPWWPLTKQRSQTCASARPQTARPPCCSRPARTAASKPGGWPRTQRVRQTPTSSSQGPAALANPALSRPLTPADGGPSWSCDFVGAYRGLVPECCCFSADGSLLAVAFQEVVTVWSPVSWELLTTLSQPPNPIRSEPKTPLKQFG